MVSFKDELFFESWSFLLYDLVLTICEKKPYQIKIKDETVQNIQHDSPEYIT